MKEQRAVSSKSVLVQIKQCYWPSPLPPHEYNMLESPSSVLRLHCITYYCCSTAVAWALGEKATTSVILQYCSTSTSTHIGTGTSISSIVTVCLREQQHYCSTNTSTNNTVAWSLRESGHRTRRQLLSLCYIVQWERRKLNKEYILCFT